jgi:CTP synthase
MSSWNNIVQRLKKPAHTVRIGVVGKYMELNDAYKSVYESLIHGGIANNTKVEKILIDAQKIEKSGPKKLLHNLDGILVPGGFGDRGIEGKILAAQFARENNIPYFGLCLGMQIAAIEFARNILNLKDATSTEFKSDCTNPIIAMMEEQKNIKLKGASMRLGLFDCEIQKGTKAYSAYGKTIIQERHRHRWEFNNKYKKLFESNGVIFSGINPDKNLVEILEIQDHPWFLGVQFHPEFQSKPFAAHPLFAAFIKAAL